MLPKLDSELFFTASRSSGSGGQNVNKVSTKVELHFDVMNSKLLTDGQKQLIFSKLKNHINKDGILKVTVQETRSQFENKEIALKKFKNLLATSFRIIKKRIRTKASKGSKEKRLSRKKNRSEIKKGRTQKWV